MARGTPAPPAPVPPEEPPEDDDSAADAFAAEWEGMQEAIVRSGDQLNQLMQSLTDHLTIHHQGDAALDTTGAAGGSTPNESSSPPPSPHARRNAGGTRNTGGTPEPERKPAPDHWYFRGRPGRGS